MSAKKLGRFAGLALALAAVAAVVAAPSTGSDTSAAVYATLEYLWT
jgi:hypothetical protein